MIHLLFFLSLVDQYPALDCLSKRRFAITNSYYPFVLEELPYRYSFLSDVLSETMVVLHHDTHHKGYLTKLNSYLATASGYQSKSLAQLCSSNYNEASLQKFAGGGYNHYLYWWVLTAPGCSGPTPTGELLTAIEDVWGSFTDFKTEFDTQSINLFGSGWVWLCVDNNKKLQVRSTQYQINPIMESDSCYPVLGNDLWDHAYYLRYTSDKSLYIKYFWDMVDWSMVEFFYSTFAINKEPVPF